MPKSMAFKRKLFTPYDSLVPASFEFILRKYLFYHQNSNRLTFPNFIALCARLEILRSNLIIGVFIYRHFNPHNRK